jgi:hypothetical protein
MQLLTLQAGGTYRYQYWLVNRLGRVHTAQRLWCVPVVAFGLTFDAVAINSVKRVRSRQYDGYSAATQLSIVSKS